MDAPVRRHRRAGCRPQPTDDRGRRGSLKARGRRMEPKSSEQDASEAKHSVSELAPAEVIAMHKRGDDVVYLDVREQQEWNLFRIPGAVHVPLGAVGQRV